MLKVLTLAGLLLFSGCASTINAKVTAYGIYTVTPFGLLGMGYMTYEREADPSKVKE